MDKYKVAERVSDIFNPYISSAPFFLLVALAASPNIAQALAYWLIMALFFSFLPMWDITRRIKSGAISDPHINRREDRIKPFLFALASAIAGLVAIYIVDAPDAIKAVCVSVVATGAVVTAVTGKWKISLHAAGITSISLILVLLFGWWATPIALCIPLVIWARLVLKRHTAAQIAAGMAVASAVVLASFAAYGLL